MSKVEELDLPLIDPTIKGQILDTGVISFSFPPQIVFGYGCLNRIGFLSLFLKAKNAFIVTDAEIEKLGISNKVQRYLEKSGIKSVVFNEVEPNPKEETIIKGSERFKSSNSDIVIAIGGGSVMDTAKIVRLIVKQGGKPKDYDATKNTIMAVHETLPHQISIPTTSGTGSEVSIVSMVTCDHEKITILGYPLISAIAVVDPELTISCPQKLTAHCGMDALTHAIEAFLSTRENPIANTFSLQAITLIPQSLRKVYSSGNDVSHRANMSLASLLAGMAFNQKSVGLVHGCSHQLSSQCNLAHGLANAILLPHVLRVNKRAGSIKYIIMAQAFGIDLSKITSEEEAQDKFILEIEKLNNDIGIPKKLSECGVKESDIGIMCELALKDISIITNPVQPVTKEIVEGIYRAAF